MTRRRNVAALGATAAIVLCAACSAVSGFDADPDPTEVSIVLDDDRETATDSLVEVFAALEAEGLEPFFASFRWADCDRRQPTYQAVANGRLDHAGGRTSTLADAQRFRDLLVELGWSPLNESFWTDGIWITDNRWHLNADRRDGFYVNIYLYREHPYIAVEVLGRASRSASRTRIRTASTSCPSTSTSWWAHRPGRSRRPPPHRRRRRCDGSARELVVARPGFWDARRPDGSGGDVRRSGC